MKKILLILPILGTCSYLFGQAPEINVHAMQEQGTKDVFIEFNASGKEGENELYYEVWFRQNSAFDWSQVSSLENAFDATPVDAVEGDFNGEWKRFSYKRGLTPWMEMVNLRWKAGTDVPGISSQDAQIRIVGFYPKKDEFGSLLTQDQQVSGWNGIGEFGNNTTSGPDNNETPSVTYVRDYSDANNYNLNFDPDVNFEDAQFGSVENKMDTLMQGYAPIGSYYDDAGGVFYSVYELYDNFLLTNTGTNPPSGMGTFAVVGVSFIPVTQQF